MKRLHPNVGCAAGFAALALALGLGGCQTQSGGAANPFLAPNRVPPPSTRMLAPGEAQPYYPGDPLPVMHSGLAPMPAASDGMAWRAPPGSEPSGDDRPAPTPHLAVNEPRIAIPTDGDALRFALPTPVERESELAMSAVVPASYTAPAAQINEGSPPLVPGPWHPPQIGPPTSVPGYAMPPTALQPPLTQFAAPVAPPAPAAPPQWPAHAAPLAAATQPMNVQLRAVPSPPPQPTQYPVPRVRLPQYAAASQPIGSNDGFRPRSSMR